MSTFRRSIYTRQQPRAGPIPGDGSLLQQKFHQAVPSYSQTPLRSLDILAKELNVKAVFIKDESSRMGLPSFKCLGASWGAFRAIANQTGLDLDTSLDKLSCAAQELSLSLYCATDGNHGRAVAWMARQLGIPAEVYIPRGVDDNLCNLIMSEGARIVAVDGDYDTAVQRAAKAAEISGGILVQDTGFPGYEDIPNWIIDGYATMFQEVETQLAELAVHPTTIITPCGVGSLSQAVVCYAKSGGRDLDVWAVEPDTAPCLYLSLQAGEPVSARSLYTTMTGLNCGTLSSTAWPFLRDHISISTTVSDYESHLAVEYLKSYGISAGPCGGAGLAALRRITTSEAIQNREDAVIVLLNTEASRPYQIPLDVSPDDPVQLTQVLTTIDSTNPSLSASGGQGENRIAEYICAWLQHRNIEAHWIESVAGRPSVVGVVRGIGNGMSIMLNGHTDTVSLATYSSDPLSGHVTSGRVYGRGCLDMKAGLAASMTALMKSSSSALKGSVILAAVSDEEFESLGTMDVIKAGWRADGAIVAEPTSMQLCYACKGFVWVEVDIIGIAAHGSNPAAGIDAVLSAGAFLTALEDYAKDLPVHPTLGPGTMHCGLIKGGEEPSSYPANCSITVEFRTVPNQTSASIVSDLERILVGIAKDRKSFNYNRPRVTCERPPLESSKNDQFVQAVMTAAGTVLEKKVEPGTAAFWCDAALLNEAGIPSVVLGPRGQGLHSREEWVDVASIRELESIFSKTIDNFCR